MKFFKNYWEHTAPAVKKLGLALRGLVATITGTAFVQGDVKLAFYVVLAGGILDFILQNLPPDKPGTPGVPPAGIVALIAFALLFVSGCTVVKPGTNTVKSDSTFTTFKQVDIKIKGAKVFAGLNLDSLYHAALMARDQAKDDSIGRLNLELKYKQDSIAALKANKPLPVKPVYITLPPKVNTVIDPDTKAQLDYWIDAYGKFQITCESKDQTITTLQAQVNKLTKQISSTVVAVPTTPIWNKWIMWGEGILALGLAIILFFKIIL